MKRLLASLLLAVCAFVSAHAAEANWLTDYDAALKKAADENKPVLINFTGSDWCGWCIKLDREVFSQTEFVDYATKNLVLVKLDFPRKKPQTDAQKAKNAELAKKYQIRGFPTIKVLNPQGKTIGNLGYEEGGAASWIKSLERVTKKS